MADRYWRGGTASWDGTAGSKWADTPGGAAGASVPTTADDVFFDATSTGTVTIAAGNTGAKSINCTGFAGTLTGATAITVAGSITLSAGMTYTVTGTVTITGTSTLITAGKTFGTLTIDGIGIVVTLGDALNASVNSITVTRGTFDTSVNNYSVTAGRILSTNSNSRTINFNASTLTLGQAQPIDFTTPTNLTFNAGTSQINVTSAGLDFNGGGQTFYNVSFTGVGPANRTITGANTFNNFTHVAPNQVPYQLIFAANQTINGTFDCTSTIPTRRTFIRSNVVGTPRTITAAVISANNCDFRDITIAGAASPISPTSAGNCGGNTNITFPAARTIYRVGTDTTWVGSNSWALDSGGGGSDNNYPVAQDTVIINNATTASSINLGENANIGNIDLSTRTTAYTLSHANITNIYGNYTLGSGVTVSGTNQTSFSGENTQVITTAGKTITFSLNINKAPANVTGPSAELGDAFLSTSTLTITSGRFDAKTYNLTCTTFSTTGSNSRGLIMGSGLWTLTGTGAVWTTSGAGLFFNRGTANILLSNTTTTARSFDNAGVWTFNKLTIGGATGTSTLTITGTNTFSELASTKTVAHTIIFPNVTTTVGAWTISGSSGNLVTLQRTGASGTWTIAKTGGGTVSADFLSISNGTATPADTWYAGTNSTNGGNNTGWLFTAAPPVGPTGVSLPSGLTIGNGITFSV